MRKRDERDGASGVGSLQEQPMTQTQAVRLKALSEQAFELEAYSPTISREEAERRIAALEAKLRLQDEPPHTL